jgi:hypothetical protein
MGQRVAEMKQPGEEYTVGWMVYQSTSGACFTPIFSNQLAAELFALALGDIFPCWDEDSEFILARQVNEVVREQFGDEPEEHPLYDDAIDPQNLAHLLSDLRQYRAKLLWRVESKR